MVLKLMFILITGGIFLLSGCWDYQEIEDRGYVLGLAIDKAVPIPIGQMDREHNEQERKIEKMPLQEGEAQYAYTIQVPVIHKAMIKPGNQGGGGSEGHKSWDLTVVGKSFFEINREYSTRLNYPPFYEHMKVIVINEDVAKEGILKHLDVILRDHEMRRRTKLFVTPQEAKSVLDVSPRIDDYASLYLDILPQNATRVARMAHITDLGEVSKSIHGELDFVLPRVIATEDEIKDAGVGVFKEGKLVGYLGEIDTIYAKFVRDAVIGGITVVESPHPTGELITLEIAETKTIVKPIVDGDSITMDIKVRMTYNLVEEMRQIPDNTYDRKFLEEVEERANIKIQEEIKDTVNYVQKEFGADIFHFNVAMQRYAPQKWQEVKNDWYDLFPCVDIQVTVKSQIKMTGLIK